MNEQEKLLVETEQRSKANSHRLDKVEEDIKEIKEDQKAIYKIATSVELIAQRVGVVEDKVDSSNNKIDILSKKVTENESEPYRQVAKNWNSVKVAIITAICTLLVTGAIGVIISFGAN